MYLRMMKLRRHAHPLFHQYWLTRMKERMILSYDIFNSRSLHKKKTNNYDFLLSINNKFSAQLKKNRLFFHLPYLSFNVWYIEGFSSEINARLPVCNRSCLYLVVFLYDNNKEQQHRKKNQRQYTDIFSLSIMRAKRNDNDPIIRSCCRSFYQCIYHEERLAGDHNWHSYDFPIDIFHTDTYVCIWKTY